MKLDEVRVIAPTGFLGYGFSFEDFKRAVKEVQPHYLAVDAGSTDPGPHYLGTGESFTTHGTVKKELEVLIGTALKNNIPLIIGSAGGCGGRPHVDWTVNIVRELSEEHNWSFPLATIDAEIDKEILLEWFEQEKIKDFESSESLTAEDIEQSTRIVAQMGIEPIMKALNSEAQVIICGRACDDAVFAAYPIMKGFDKGLSIHMGKILECGALASEPISMDVMIGRLKKDYFSLEPGSHMRKCTVTSVSSHSLYEREDPIKQLGPGGGIDLTNTRFEQFTDRIVRISDTRYEETSPYYIKLEGVRKIGYRTICIVGVRDPIMVKNIDSILERLRDHANNYIKRMGYGTSKIVFHIYGKDGVMKNLEPLTLKSNHELGIVIDVVAEDQEKAKAICHEISGKFMHLDFDNQYNNAGNLAFLYSPSEIDVGPVYGFSVYHLAEIDDPTTPFPVTVSHLENGKLKEEITV